MKDKYDDYRQAALSGGAPADQVELAIKDMREQDEKIDACTCPRCGFKITRTLDPRQAGPTSVAGKWFKYRCTECPWFTDRCEPIGEN